MKKIILSTIILAALSSCKKEGSKSEEISKSKDSVSVSEKMGNETTAFISPELSAKDVSLHLAKNNDTLYVTNFFATWCGPCLREIPHFKKKMQELKGQPVKFTFVDLDDKAEWNTSVRKFAKEHDLARNIILVDAKQLDSTFFKTNFKQWDGASIPFTYMRKGAKTDELLGMITEQTLDSKIKSFLK